MCFSTRWRNCRLRRPKETAKIPSGSLQIRHDPIEPTIVPDTVMATLVDSSPGAEPHASSPSNLSSIIAFQDNVAFAPSSSSPPLLEPLPANEHGAPNHAPSPPSSGHEELVLLTNEFLHQALLYYPTPAASSWSMYKSRASLTNFCLTLALALGSLMTGLA